MVRMCPKNRIQNVLFDRLSPKMNSNFDFCQVVPQSEFKISCLACCSQICHDLVPNIA